MAEITEAAHQANHAREAAALEQTALTAAQLHERLSRVIADGKGDWPVALMVVDGLTHAVPITDCFAAQPDADGELVWLI